MNRSPRMRRSNQRPMGRSFTGRNRRRNRRRLAGTVVRVHNRRPIPPQTDPKPLSYGSGGMSTTIRVVRPVFFTIQKTESQKLTAFGGQDELTITKILEGYINLGKQFEEIRINSAKAVLTCNIGADTSALAAMALVPYSFNDWSPNPTIKNFYQTLDQGVFVLKHAYKQNAAAWLPTQPDDFNYYDITNSGTNDIALFKVQVAGMLTPTDFSVFSTQKCPAPAQTKDCETYMFGHITYDINVVLRGRNTTAVPGVLGSSACVAKDEGRRGLQLTCFGPIDGFVNIGNDCVETNTISE